ncbi:MAG: HAD-IC family P-type ATPase, partial [Clostridia bacterium]|nr:HAD-IC family P-type ATPase [Clostridia bacterium]
VLPDDNPTFNAVKSHFPGDTGYWTADEIVPFSSARKWSGAHFTGRGVYVMGAGEFILRDRFDALKAYTERFTNAGQRVLLLARADKPFGADKTLPADIEPVGFIAISDKIRAEAPDTLRYFAEQGVTLKVISGDNARTVSSIAKRAGLEGAENCCDASTLRTDAEIEDAIERYTVFGRVTPQQKLQFVRALKKHGHTVAMTGDGVNDVLALKEADCSVAMASGSDAARTVSNLVLLDSNFASMPQVVREGRRSINNLQRSASLFLQKTIFSAILGVLFIFIAASYPFQPIQLTFVSTITIGIPSFILALEPNTERIRGIFLTNVLKKSFPSALAMILSVLCLTFFQKSLGLTEGEVSTLCVLAAFTAGFALLFKLCRPFNPLRAALFCLMLGAAVLGNIFFRELFSLVPMTAHMTAVFIPLAAAMLLFILLTNRFSERIAEKYADRFLTRFLSKKRQSLK